MEREHEVRPAFTSEHSMRSRRALQRPADTQQRGKHEPRLCSWPDAHAASKRSVTWGIASPCSKRSARTRSASTSALERASSRLEPYANTPGSATTSAIQRPSSSRSISTTNRPADMRPMYQPAPGIARHTQPMWLRAEQTHWYRSALLDDLA